MNPVAAFLRIPHALALFNLVGDAHSTVRLHFLLAAARGGLLRALPATRGELIERLAIRRPELLDALLDLGVELKELRADGERFRLRGRRARALASDDGDPALAMIDELLTYHSDVYLRLPGRLRGEASGNYLDEHAVVIIRSSRVLEPLIADFAASLVRGDRPMRLLEIGCGSGVYLRHAAEANLKLTGAGVDLQPDVVEMARQNIRGWGLSERFEIHQADARQLPPALSGPFDVITLFNNLYYFAEGERAEVLGTLGSLLAPGGVLAVVSLFRGRTMMSLDLDIALRSTQGCTALPQLEETKAQLGAAGFSRVTQRKLMPVEPLWGLSARRSEA
jgi:SAM-dependent methyltransferase